MENLNYFVSHGIRRFRLLFYGILAAAVLPIIIALMLLVAPVQAQRFSELLIQLINRLELDVSSSVISSVSTPTPFPTPTATPPLSRVPKNDYSGNSKNGNDAIDSNPVLAAILSANKTEKDAYDFDPEIFENIESDCPRAILNHEIKLPGFCSCVIAIYPLESIKPKIVYTFQFSARIVDWEKPIKVYSYLLSNSPECEVLKFATSPASGILISEKDSNKSYWGGNFIHGSAENLSVIAIFCTHSLENIIASEFSTDTPCDVITSHLEISEVRLEPRDIH